MTVLKRLIAGMSFFAVSILPTFCQTVPAGHGASPPAAEDRLEIESKRLAGPGAIDCGRVKINGDPKKATQCALDAQKSANPFRVLYDLQGIDSVVAIAIVRTDIGTVGTLTYDSDPSGGGNVGAVIWPKRCPEPVHVSITPSGRLDCFQDDASPPK